jgi:cytochrome c oxidase subunit IV
MLTIFGILYFILLIIYILAGIFIIYHLVKFSLSKSVMILTVGIFVSVFAALLLTNITLFFAIPWVKVLSDLI